MSIKSKIERLERGRRSECVVFCEEDSDTGELRDGQGNAVNEADYDTVVMFVDAKATT